MERNKSDARKIELLAPAGDILALKAALIAGADAVYLGGKHFGARGFAQNFDEKGLRWARRVTKSAGRKLYLTLNTLVFDHEFEFLEKTLDFYESLQPDALIIQDLGVASLLKKRRSAIPRHLSTQGAWDGNGGVEILRDLGFSRIILPREFTIVQIQEMCQKSGMQIEVFVHGAMCYSVSGRCFWSAALGERSGNRGTCAQPCRKIYNTRSKNNGFYFSPKDLRLAGSVTDLVSSGVSCLKIEGRMKDADYVFNVVSIYRRLLGGEPWTTTVDQELDAVFSRPAHTGFLKGSPDANWYTVDGPGRHGMRIGVVHSKRRPDGLIEIHAEYQLKMGDGVAWNEGDKKNGARITWVEKLQSPHSIFAVRGLPDLPIGTGLILTDSSSDRRWLSSWQKDWERIPIDLFWSGFEGQPLAVEAVFNDRPVRILSQEVLTRSKGTGLEAGPINEKFSNLGELFRVTRHVTKALEKGLFLSPTSLKKLKRELLETLARFETAPSGGRFPRIAPGATGNNENIPADCFRDPSETVSFPFEAEDVAFPENNGNGSPVAAMASDSESSKTCTNSEIIHPRVTVRLWSAKDFPGIGASPDRWLVPLQEAPPQALPMKSVGFWIAPLETPDDLHALVEKLETLPDQEFLCMGWEVFELAKRVPRHSFRLDWTFNLANSGSLRLFLSKGFSVTCAREWPNGKPPAEAGLCFGEDPFREGSMDVSRDAPVLEPSRDGVFPNSGRLPPAVFWQVPWNSLVSFSRFKPDLPPGEMIFNPHGDAFFVRRVGSTTLLFLKNRPARKMPVPVLPVQIDFALAPDENPQKAMAELREFVSEIKKTA